MKINTLIFTSIVLLAFSSFTKPKITTCKQIEFSIEFVQKEILIALEEENFNRSKFHTYRAVNTLENSKKQLTSCNCIQAKGYINNGLTSLIEATKSPSLVSVKQALNKSLERFSLGLRELKSYRLDNTLADKNSDMVLKMTALHKEKIDAALATYEKSLGEVVISIDYEEAFAFANKIYLNCEKQLLKQNLSEPKRYYNLRTKEITKKALDKLLTCND